MSELIVTVITLAITTYTVLATCVFMHQRPPVVYDPQLGRWRAQRGRP